MAASDGRGTRVVTQSGRVVGQKTAMAAVGATRYRRYASTHNTAMTESSSRAALETSGAGRYLHAPANRSAMSVSRAARGDSACPVKMERPTRALERGLR